MKKAVVLALLVVFLMPLAASQVLAADETAQAGTVDVGNKLCPVMGGPVSGNDFVVYEGKRYGLCCPGCERTFLGDPALYSAKAAASMAAVTTNAEASEEMEKDMDQGSL